MQRLTNIRCLYTVPPQGEQAETGPVPDATLVWDESGIVWAGKTAELPAAYTSARKVDAGGAIVLPGLVDCHTHLLFGGWRADEFHQRNQGVSYQEIAQSGGGILRTMQQTRLMDTESLADHGKTVLDAMLRLGVTTVECKTGYGLSFDSEITLLEAYHKLQRVCDQQLAVTLLAAHTVPPEYAQDRHTYIRVIEELIRYAGERKRANACDVFAEEGAFSIEEARHILEIGKTFGLLPKIHADQLTDGGGAVLAGDVGAVSADHLEHISDDGIRALQRANTIAVSLPLAAFYLRQHPMPARKLIASGVRVAVATDFNPGSAPSYHLPLAMHMACVMQQMTAHEVLKGATAYAAAACGLPRTGSLMKGYRADFVLLDAPDIEHWMYHFREGTAAGVVLNGQVQFGF